MAIKHLLGLQHTPKSDIEYLLSLAKHFKNNNPKEVQDFSKQLLGKQILLAFFENSTRTRLSFELACKNLGASTLGFTTGASSISKGETLSDTIKTIDSMGIDGVIVRHNHSGSARAISKFISKPVINAGDGLHEHPTQALLDLFTLQENYNSFKDLRVLILGDILHSRVARSNIFGLQKMGAKVSLCAPISLLPVGLKEIGITCYTNLNEAIEETDAIILLRLQLEREAGGFIPSIDDYSRQYKLTDAHLRELGKKVLILHPGPLNREIELTNTVADAKSDELNFQSQILNQVGNGVFVRMAALQYVFE